MLKKLINKIKNKKNKAKSNKNEWYELVHEKAENEWEQIWNEIYKLQKILPLDLPDNEDELLKRGYVYTYGKNGEKLIITKELSNRLFAYRMMY